RLAAAELLRGAQRGGRPGALLRRLAQSDPQVRLWLGDRHEPPANLQALLP
ncbi:MAG: GTPase, partial [Cyanobacteria bacterium]|nr:GTPase [Cyanobacteriota bacterium]